MNIVLTIRKQEQALSPDADEMVHQAICVVSDPGQRLSNNQYSRSILLLFVYCRLMWPAMFDSQLCPFPNSSKPTIS